MECIQIKEKSNFPRKKICQIKNFYIISLVARFSIFSLIIRMAKGKCTYQIGKSSSGISWYIYPVQKKNLPQGEKLKLKKYDKKLRKHVEFTFKDVK